MRPWPRSLVGQTLMALALALLAAQAVSGVLLYRAAEQRRETALLHTAAFELVTGPDRRTREGRRFAREIRRSEGAPPGRLPRALRYRESAAPPVLAGEYRDAAREQALAALLARHGIEVAEIAVVERSASADPLVGEARERSRRIRARLERGPHRLLVVGLRQEGSASWRVARVPVASGAGRVLAGLVLQTLILFVLLMALLWLALRRITRPLAALTERTARFGGRGASDAPLDPSGPDDIRRLIVAYNAMEARVAAMLDEKDVMLGAIGHDLKTPLAALRVRVEAVEDESQRERMAVTIEEVTNTLDDILDLARIGRARTPPERAELSALVVSVVEEFEDMGGRVTMTEGPRVSTPVQITWLKRGLRNLVANALRYGGSARVSLAREDGCTVLRVEDEGPGIPEDRIEAMIEPFVRGEASRNRETGGAGLGLTLARAVAEQHGGKLVLSNRPEGGLRAEIRLADRG